MHQFRIKMADRNATSGENYEYVISMLRQIVYQDRTNAGPQEWLLVPMARPQAFG